MREHGTRSHRSRAPRASEGGFTLIEMLISLAALTVIIVGTLTLFDRSNRIASTQLAKAEMQQSARVAQRDLTRKARLTGRGGLLIETPTYQMPDGAALEVIQNVPSSTTILPTDNTSPAVLEGTDVLVVRGAFNFPVYFVGDRDTGALQLDTANDRGTIRIDRLTPIGGVVQHLGYLDRIKDDGNPRPLLLSSAFDPDTWGVVELLPGTSSVVDTDGDGQFDEATLAFRYLDDDGSDDNVTALVDPSAPGSPREAFSALSSTGSFPEVRIVSAGVRSVAILEEFRYYIREANTVEGDNTTPLAPKLSRAEVYPNLDVVYPDGSLREDIADHVWDLQVAYGCDPDVPPPPVGAGVEDGIFVDDGGAADSWEGNNTGDDLRCPTLGAYRSLRINTLVRAPAPDRQWQAPLLTNIEDHDYSGSDLNSTASRQFNRVVLQTFADLRNLG